MQTEEQRPHKEMDLSVDSCGSVDNGWSGKPKKPIISKIIERDTGDCAIILTHDVSKPIRFLYLTLLTAKNRFDHLRNIILRIQKLIREGAKILFQDLSLQMNVINSSLPSLLKNLNVLLKKMEHSKKKQVIITQLCEQFEAVDPLLILSLRAIASSSQFGVRGVLSCSYQMSFLTVNEILRKFGINKDDKNQLNKFVLFIDLNQIEKKFFSEQGISIERQQQNCQQLFDAYLIKYEEQIVLEQLYSLIEQNP